MTAPTPTTAPEEAGAGAGFGTPEGGCEMHEDDWLEAQYEERTTLRDDLDPFEVAEWPSRYTSEPDADEDGGRFCGDCDADVWGNDPHAPGCRFEFDPEECELDDCGHYTGEPV